MSERTNDPERIYLEPPPYSPEGRQWCADDVWPLDGDGPGGVEYVRADLATPEPGGEARTALIRETAHCAVQRVATLANMREPDGGYWLWEMRSEVVDWVVGEMKEDNKGEAWKPIKGATPAASEDVRDSVRQAVEWGIEDAWPRYNRIYDPHDPDDESRQEWVDCITEQVVTALLRTPRGEGEAALVEAVLRRWNRLAADVEGSEGPLTETELVGIARDVAAALRSEAQGEGGDDERCGKRFGPLVCVKEPGHVGMHMAFFSDYEAVARPTLTANEERGWLKRELDEAKAEVAAVLDAVEAEADKWDDGIVPSFASRETVREIRRRLAALRSEAQGE